MAKRTATTSTKAPLTTLVERLSPGSVTLVKPTYSLREGRDAYEITVQTRECPITFVGDTIDEVATDALSFMDDPEEDPVVPHWSRCSRMQRQVVVQTLREHAARHMARAAEAKVTHSTAALGAYEVADAFQAAVEMLDHDDLDDQSTMLPREPLSADGVPPGVPFTKAKAKAKRTVGPGIEV